MWKDNEVENDVVNRLENISDKLFLKVIGRKIEDAKKAERQATLKYQDPFYPFSQRQLEEEIRTIYIKCVDAIEDTLERWKNL